jgi:hypothetical protein
MPVQLARPIVDFFMELNTKAIESLRKILEKELGEGAKYFSDDDVKAFGLRLLKLTSVVAKKHLAGVTS